jgi:hypothetical protein
MIDRLNSTSFSEQLNTIFRVEVPEAGALPLELIEVKEYAYNPEVEQFILIFRGPKSPWFDQKIHTLRHDVLGNLDLFIGPMGPDELGMKYQVVINRFRK